METSFVDFAISNTPDESESGGEAVGEGSGPGTKGGGSTPAATATSTPETSPGDFMTLESQTWNPGARVDYGNSSNMLTIYDGGGEVVGIYPAANNAQSGSRGPWEQGLYDFAYHVPHAGLGADSAYGSNGNFVFDVDGCVGCGIHSGRANMTDLAGRQGVNFATNGCIRTTDAATRAMSDSFSRGDPIRTLRVLR